MGERGTRAEVGVDMCAFARIAREEALRHEGVARMEMHLSDRLCRCRRIPGVTARVDRHGWLHIDLDIVARQSEQLHQLGASVQQSVWTALRRVSNQPVGRVNVRITNITNS